MSLLSCFFPCFNRNKVDRKKYSSSTETNNAPLDDPDKNEVSYGYNDSLDSDDFKDYQYKNCTFITVIFDKIPHRSYGFTIIGGMLDHKSSTYSPIKISQLIEDGIAKISNLLEINDIIVGANSVSLKNVEHDYAASVISSATSTLCLNVMRNTALFKQSTDYSGYKILIFDIHFDDNLKISLSSMYCQLYGWRHVITAIVTKNSSPDEQCTLKIGDCIIEIGELFCDQLTREYLINKLFISKSITSIKVCRKQTKEDSSESLDCEMHKKKPLQNLTSEEEPNFMNPSSDKMVDAMQLLGERIVYLKRDSNGYGMNIIGSDTGDGIFVYSLTPEGPASKSGLIFKGDRILMANSIDLTNAVHDFAIGILRSNKKITLKVIYSPKELEAFESNNMSLINHSSKNSDVSDKFANIDYGTFFVRTLFDHNLSSNTNVPSRALQFKHGTILQVSGNQKDLWWKATIVDDRNLSICQKGIIPSNVTMQKRSQTRNKSVKFAEVSRLESKESKDVTNLRFSLRNFERNGENQSNNDNSNNQKCFYQIVYKGKLDFFRPIVICGALKDRIIEHLARLYPKLIIIPIPYTTKPQMNQNPANVIDDHFIIERKLMIKLIESGLYAEIEDNLNEISAVSISSLKQIVQQSAHSVVSLTNSGINCLEKADLYPIVIFINAISIEWILHHNRRMTRDQAEIHLNYLYRQQKQLSDHIIEVISLSSLEEIYERVFSIIQRETLDNCWIPIKSLR